MKCKACAAQFVRQRPLQRACSPTCALNLVQAARAKKERNETRAKLAALKPRQQWLREAQAAFNAYVRARDRNLPCVSCGRPATWDGQWHASHLRSVGAASAVRFSLWNVHKACSICNNWKSGNLSEYEPRLRARIGDAKVDWLRAQNAVTAYSIDYLRRLKRIFAKRARSAELIKASA